MGPTKRNISKWGCFISLSTLLCLQSVASGGAEDVEYSPLDDARIVGLADMPELIVPMDIPGWAADLGITGVERVYKGICGPDGAVISIDDLMRAAERDLARGAQQNRAVVTETVGESPAFAMTYNDSDPVLPVFYMPAVRRAAEYVDQSLDNRVQIGASIALGTFGGNTIGSASSVRFKIPWDVYVRGLRAQSKRDDPRFAASLPDSALNVLYQGSTTPTSETDIRVTSAQLRAIFGDNVVPQGEAVSITFNSGVFWNYFGCDTDPVGTQVSLIDVAVHEFTHALGFTSGINAGGSNPELDIRGLDVARFRSANLPFNNTQFRTNPRIGGEFTNEPHLYRSTPTGGATQLESGDGHQPSHLNFVSNHADKLGVMDPVLSSGTTHCPVFYSADDLQPLDDMGWRPTVGNQIADCNGNGQFDALDILLGVSQDVDNDSIPDECEGFVPGILNTSTPQGVRRNVYVAPGLTDLAGFVPNGPNSILVESIFVTDMDDSLSFSSTSTRVVDYDFFMFAPGRNEYAFRLAHPADMILTIDGILIDNSTESGELTRSSVSTNISSQSFIQLENGWHRVRVRALLHTRNSSVRLMRESRGIGHWEDIPSSHLHQVEFDDCDNNGRNDIIDISIDLSAVTNLGVQGVYSEPVILTTLNSDFDFDTMLALWDADGDLITFNDDNSAADDRTSEITRTLSEGTYFVAVSGFPFTFADGPSVSRDVTCSDDGNFQFNINGTLVASGAIQTGRLRMFSFSVFGPDCDDDGTPDSQERDCNNDGIPDDCQVPTIAEAIDVGVVGNSAETIVISTCDSPPSQFDSVLALWDESGALLSFNDDSCARLSEIEASLAPGIYYTVIAGFVTNFGEGFEINVNASGCSDGTGGAGFIIQIGSSTRANGFNAGQALMYRFEIEQSPACSPADLNGDGNLNFFDVSAFLSAFSAGEPAADFTDDGQFNFFDVSAFLNAFSAGCP